MENEQKTPQPLTTEEIQKEAATVDQSRLDSYAKLIQQEDTAREQNLGVVPPEETQTMRIRRAFTYAQDLLKRPEAEVTEADETAALTVLNREVFGTDKTLPFFQHENMTDEDVRLARGGEQKSTWEFSGVGGFGMQAPMLMARAPEKTTPKLTPRATLQSLVLFLEKVRDQPTPKDMVETLRDNFLTEETRAWNKLRDSGDEAAVLREAWKGYGRPGTFEDFVKSKQEEIKRVEDITEKEWGEWLAAQPEQFQKDWKNWYNGAEGQRLKEARESSEYYIERNKTEEFESPFMTQKMIAAADEMVRLRREQPKAKHLAAVRESVARARATGEVIGKKEAKHAVNNAFAAAVAYAKFLPEGQQAIVAKAMDGEDLSALRGFFSALPDDERNQLMQVCQAVRPIDADPFYWHSFKDATANLLNSGARFAKQFAFSMQDAYGGDFSDEEKAKFAKEIKDDIDWERSLGRYNVEEAEGLIGKVLQGVANTATFQALAFTGHGLRTAGKVVPNKLAGAALQAAGWMADGLTAIAMAGEVNDAMIDAGVEDPTLRSLVASVGGAANTAVEYLDFGVWKGANLTPGQARRVGVLAGLKSAIKTWAKTHDALKTGEAVKRSAFATLKQALTVGAAETGEEATQGFITEVSAQIAKNVEDKESAETLTLDWAQAYKKAWDAAVEAAPACFGGFGFGNAMFQGALMNNRAGRLLGMDQLSIARATYEKMLADAAERRTAQEDFDRKNEEAQSARAEANKEVLRDNVAEAARATRGMSKEERKAKIREMAPNSSEADLALLEKGADFYDSLVTMDGEDMADDIVHGRINHAQLRAAGIKMETDEDGRINRITLPDGTSVETVTQKGALRPRGEAQIRSWVDEVNKTIPDANLNADDILNLSEEEQDAFFSNFETHGSFNPNGGSGTGKHTVKLTMKNEDGTTTETTAEVPDNFLITLTSPTKAEDVGRTSKNTTPAHELAHAMLQQYHDAAAEKDADGNPTGNAKRAQKILDALEERFGTDEFGNPTDWNENFSQTVEKKLNAYFADIEIKAETLSLKNILSNIFKGLVGKEDYKAIIEMPDNSLKRGNGEKVDFIDIIDEMTSNAIAEADAAYQAQEEHEAQQAAIFHEEEEAIAAAAEETRKAEEEAAKAEAEAKAAEEEARKAEEVRARGEAVRKAQEDARRKIEARKAREKDEKKRRKLEEEQQKLDNEWMAQQLRELQAAEEEQRLIQEAAAKAEAAEQAKREAEAKAAEEKRVKEEARARREQEKRIKEAEREAKRKAREEAKRKALEEKRIREKAKTAKAAVREIKANAKEKRAEQTDDSADKPKLPKRSLAEKSIQSFLNSEFGQDCRLLQIWLDKGKRLFQLPPKGTAERAYLDGLDGARRLALIGRNIATPVEGGRVPGRQTGELDRGGWDTTLDEWYDETKPEAGVSVKDAERYSDVNGWQEAAEDLFRQRELYSRWVENGAFQTAEEEQEWQTARWEEEMGQDGQFATDMEALAAREAWEREMYGDEDAVTIDDLAEADTIETGGPTEQDLIDMGIMWSIAPVGAAARADYERRIADILKRAPRDAQGRLLAPNGKPSNLTERQYAQVRTPEFKTWFGDWETLAELNAVRDFLFNSAPVVEIGGTEFQKDNVSLVDKVSEYFTSQYGNRAISPDLGEVILDRRGVKSSMAHGIGAVKAAAYAAVHDVIEKGKVFDRQRDWKGRGKDTAVIAAPVRIGEKDYICEVVVETSGRGNEFYLHEVNLKEKIAETIKTPTGGAASANNAQPFVRSIFAQKWSKVNPSAVSKVVDENGEPMVVYHGSRWDMLKEPAGRAVFKETRHAKDRGFFFGDEGTADMWDNAGLGAKAFFLNIRNPRMIDVADELREMEDGIDEETFEMLRDRWNGGDAGKEFEPGKGATAYFDDNTYEIYDYVDQDGNDGVWVEAPDGTRLINVFDSNAIKSATDNTGAFDAANPDIRFSVTGLGGVINLTPNECTDVVQNYDRAVQMLGEKNWCDLTQEEADRIVRETGWQVSGRRWVREVRVVQEGFDLRETFQRVGEDFGGGFAGARLFDLLGGNNALFTLYPAARKIIVYLDKDLECAGKYNPATGNISIKPSNAEDNRNTLEHEIQHFIQDAEGFELGTTIEYEGRTNNRRKEIADVYNKGRKKLLSLQRKDAKAAAELAILLLRRHDIGDYWSTKGKKHIALTDEQEARNFAKVAVENIDSLLNEASDDDVINSLAYMFESQKNITAGLLGIVIRDCWKPSDQTYVSDLITDGDRTPVRRALQAFLDGIPNLREINRAFDEAMKKLNEEEPDPVTAYFRNAGEAQARRSGKRVGLSDAERAQNPFYREDAGFRTDPSNEIYRRIPSEKDGRRLDQEYRRRHFATIPYGKIEDKAPSKPVDLTAGNLFDFAGVHWSVATARAAQARTQEGIERDTFSVHIGNFLKSWEQRGGIAYTPNEAIAIQTAAKAFFDDFSSKVIELSDGSGLYFAPSPEAIARLGNNADAWAEYAVHAVTNGSGRTRKFDQGKVDTIARIEDIVREDRTRALYEGEAGRSPVTGIAFRGTGANNETIDIITRLDERGNPNADLTEVTTRRTKEIENSPLAPLAETRSACALQSRANLANHASTPDSMPQSAAGVNRGARYSILGEKGAARLDDAEKVIGNLGVARQMLGARDWTALDREEQRKILIATGWQKGADGKWRYEVPDVTIKMVILENLIESKPKGNLYPAKYLWQLLSDTEETRTIMTAYPSLSEMRVYSIPKEGVQTAFVKSKKDPTKEWIQINPLKFIKEDGTVDYEWMTRSIKHEIQHAIQTREGFAFGSAPNDLNYERYAGEVEARNVAKRTYLSKERRRNLLLEESEDVAREDQVFFYYRDDAYAKLASARFSVAPNLARQANTTTEAAQALKRDGVIGKVLHCEKLNMDATISGNALSKMLSDKAVKQSASAALHARAIANIDVLFSNAEIEITHPDTHGRKEVVQTHRVGTLMDDGNNKILPVMITVLEYRRNGNKIYTVEAIDVDKANSAGQLVLGENAQETPIAKFKDRLSHLAAGVNGGARYSVAYHGSPHDFARFDLSKMGSGEGAQAHGWGIYVAINEATSRGYAERLARPVCVPTKILYKGKEVENNELLRDLRLGNEQQAAWEIAQQMLNGKTFAEAKEWEKSRVVRGGRELVDKVQESDIEIQRGHRGRYLYTVEIPDEKDGNYLHEGNPLTPEQRQMIEAQMKKDGIPNYFPHWLERSVYLGGENSRRDYSEFLSRCGFVGIKYDGRQDGPCAVIFNADDVQITSHERWSVSAGTLNRLAPLAQGQTATLQNAKYGEIQYPMGRTGKHGFGLLHIIEQRMVKDGKTLEEAVDIALRVGEAVVSGDEKFSYGNKRGFDAKGVRAIIALNPDKSKPVITGYEIEKNADEDAGGNRASATLQQQLPLPKETVVAALSRRIAELRAAVNGGNENIGRAEGGDQFSVARRGAGNVTQDIREDARRFALADFANYLMTKMLRNGAVTAEDVDAAAQRLPVNALRATGWTHDEIIVRGMAKLQNDVKAYRERVKKDADYASKRAGQVVLQRMEKAFARAVSVGQVYQRAADKGKELFEGAIERVAQLAEGMDYQRMIQDFGIDVEAALLAMRPDRKPRAAASAGTGDTSEEPGVPAADDAPEADAAEPTGEEAAELLEAARKAVELGRALAQNANRLAAEKKAAEERSRKEREENGAKNADASLDFADKENDTEADGNGTDDDILPDNAQSFLLKAIRESGVTVDNPLAMVCLVRSITEQYLLKHPELAPDMDPADPFGSSIARAVLMSNIASFANAVAKTYAPSYARIRIAKRAQEFTDRAFDTLNQIEKAGEAIFKDLNRDIIRQTSTQLCRKLEHLLKNKLGARGKFQNDRESIKRKVPAELELQARALRKVMWLTPEAAQEMAKEINDKMDRIATDFENEGRDADNSREMITLLRTANILREYGALRYKPVADIQKALDDWTERAKNGTDETLRSIEEREARTKKAAEVLAKAFRNPKLKEAKESKGPTMLGALYSHYGFINLLRTLMRHADDIDAREAEAVIDWFDNEINKCGTRADAEKRRIGKDLAEAVKRIYKRDIRKVIAELAEPDERFMEFMGKRDGLPVVPTRGRAIQLYVSLLQEGRRVAEIDEKTGEETVHWEGGYHDNIVTHKREGQAEKIKALLSKQDLELIKWIGDQYEANRASLSEVSTRLFGVGVNAELSNYFPVRMQLESKGMEKASGGGWSIFPKALMPRVRNNRDFDTSADFLSMYIARMEEGAQWKAHAELGLEMRGVFGRSELQETLKAHHGANVNRLVLGFVTDILSGYGTVTRDGADASCVFDNVRGWCALGALSFNFGVFFKQLTSLPACGFEIGLVDTVKHTLTWATPEGMDALAELWNSDQRKMRWQSGNSEAIANALRNRDASALKRVFQAGMILNKMGDIGAYALVAQGIYRDCLAKGMSKEDAMARTWAIVERCQQSSRIENQPAFLRRQPFGKLLFQFLSTQIQYLQYETSALMGVAAKPGDFNRWKTMVRNVTLNHLVLASAYYWMGELFKTIILGDDPDKEKQKEQWIASMLLGPFGALFVIGGTCSTAINSFISGKFNTGTTLPSLNYLDNILRDIGTIGYSIFSNEKTADDVIDGILKFLKHTNAPARDAMKFYENRIK